MSEPLHDLSPSEGNPSLPGVTAVDAAFDKPNDLPFFDLDIALIRRGQQSPVSQPKPIAAKSPAPEFTRERKALDALEALLAERATPKSGAPVSLFPKITPVAALLMQAAPQYIEPHVMPVPPQTQAPVGFVSPGFERVTVMAPAAGPTIEEGEPLAALATALLQTAGDVTAVAADLLPELKLQLVRQAIAQRETILFKAQRAATQAAWRPTPQPAVAKPAAPVADTADTADDLPWGHVTYRLMVM